MLVLAGCGISFCFLLMNQSWGANMYQGKFWEKLEGSNGLPVFKIMFRCSTTTMASASVLKSANQTRTLFFKSEKSLILINDIVESSSVRFNFVLAFNNKQSKNPHKTLKIQDSQKCPKRPLFNLKSKRNSQHVYLTSTCTESIQPFYLPKSF